MSEQNNKPKQVITVEEKIPFIANMSSRYTTTMALSTEVSNLFAAAMPDYIGCKIHVNDGKEINTPYGRVENYISNEFRDAKEGNKKTPKGPGNLYVDIYFKYTGYDMSNYNFDKNTYEALKYELEVEEADYRRKSVLPISVEIERNNIIAEAKKRLAELEKGATTNTEKTEVPKKVAGVDEEPRLHNIKARYLNMTNTRFKSGKTYEVLKHTYEMLEQFMPREEKTEWAKHTYETSSGISMYNSREEIVVCITGLDLDKIMKTIYAATDEDGIYDYRCLPSTVIANRLDDYVVTVERLDNGVIAELISSIGAYSNNNSSFIRCR